MYNKNLLKWVIYSILVLLSAVFQGTPHLLPMIASVMPLIVIPCVITIAMFEGETAGAAFGISGGLLWDIENWRAFGFNAFFLMLMCIFVALLIQNLFRNTIVSGILFCACAAFIQQVVTWFFFIYLAGSEQFLVSLFRIILPTVAYTVLFELLFYYLIRYINKKFKDNIASIE